MSRYADPTKEDDTKPTMALDYSYVRKDAKRESAQVMLPAGFFSLFPLRCHVVHGRIDVWGSGFRLFLLFPLRSGLVRGRIDQGASPLLLLLLLTCACFVCLDRVEAARRFAICGRLVVVAL